MCTFAHYRYPGAQRNDLHENFGEDFMHWPRDPELLGDTSLCVLWSKLPSYLETAFGSSMVAPIRRDTASIPRA